MTIHEDPSLDPSHRMMLAIQYTEHGGVADVEAIAVPTWRDTSVDETLYDPDIAPLEGSIPPFRSAVATGPLPPDEDVTLLFVRGARLVLRFDDVPPRAG